MGQRTERSSRERESQISRGMDIALPSGAPFSLSERQKNANKGFPLPFVGRSALFFSFLSLSFPMCDDSKTATMRRKRLKVVSACGECRRKKTKCDGERPCSGCTKARVDCQYTISSTTASTAAARAKPHQESPTATSPYHPQPVHSRSHIRSIEERLSVIENILRVMLTSQTPLSQEDLFAALDRQRPVVAADFFGLQQMPPKQENTATAVGGAPPGIGISSVVRGQQHIMATSGYLPPVQLPPLRRPLPHHPPSSSIRDFFSSIDHLNASSASPSSSPDLPSHPHHLPSAFQRVAAFGPAS